MFIAPTAAPRALRALTVLVACAVLVRCRAEQAGGPDIPQSVAACQSCHAEIVQSFVRTAHFNTSTQATAATVKGHFQHGRDTLRTHLSAVFFAMDERDDGFYQTGIDSIRRATRSARFDIVIGSARRGQSYIYWKNRLLFQLPVSYLTATDGWINSPGYADGQVDFDRLIVPRCLECHSTSFSSERTVSGAVYSGIYELGITCGKCHGDGARHAAAAAAKRPEGSASLIRNPARLDRERRLDNCALCHSGNRQLTGPPFSYQTGDTLSNYLAPDPNEGMTVPDVHGNQVGLLRLSKCFRSSPDMSCSTCHNVHQPQRDVTALAQNCLKCHQTASHPNAAQIGDRMISKCVDCHMPISRSGALQINTPAGTDAFSIRSHRIAVYPDAAARELTRLRR